jgi:hypothetical protein
MLRPVGQLLDEAGIQSFSLIIEGDAIVVRGERRAKIEEPGSGGTLKAIWRRLSETSPEKSAPAPETATVEMRYTPSDLARLEAAGRAKRQSADDAPEVHSLSQILRAAGSFVDQKNGRLIAIRKEGLNVTFEYESAVQTKIREQFTVSGLYDFWVKMYLKRGGRPLPKY